VTEAWLSATSPGYSTGSTPFEDREDTMANSKSKHRRVRHKIRLRWKRRRERKKAAEKAAGAAAAAKKAKK
jgi:hypothetical protein